MAKRKRNYYKILFYLLLLTVIAYWLLQARKKNNKDYVTVQVPKSACPVTMIMKHNLLVIDQDGKAHSESEWFNKKNKFVLAKF